MGIAQVPAEQERTAGTTGEAMTRGIASAAMTTETAKRVCVLLVSLLIAGFVTWKGYTNWPIGPEQDSGSMTVSVMTALFAMTVVVTSLAFFCKDPDYSEGH